LGLRERSVHVAVSNHSGFLYNANFFINTESV